MKIKEIKEFINESNAIESEFSQTAYEDSYAAWQEAMEFDVLTKDRLLEIHHAILRRLRPDIAGKLRVYGGWIGSRLCPKPSLVPALLDNWLLDHADAKTEKAIKQAHIAFEKIHPFEDGNGRTGRIIMNWQRINAGLPLLIIHAGKEQQEYYTWFD